MCDYTCSINSCVCLHAPILCKHTALLCICFCICKSSIFFFLWSQLHSLLWAIIFILYLSLVFVLVFHDCTIGTVVLPLLLTLFGLRPCQAAQWTAFCVGSIFPLMEIKTISDSDGKFSTSARLLCSCLCKPSEHCVLKLFVEMGHNSAPVSVRLCFSVCLQGVIIK